MTNNPTPTLAVICAELQRVYRHATYHLKSRIMTENRLVSWVAISLGYSPDMAEAGRAKMFTEAKALINRIQDGEPHATLSAIVESTKFAIDAFGSQETALMKRMTGLAKQLPVADWVTAPAQRGFDFKSLARILGETGDLSNYAAPGKLWRRMGCAPFESKSKNLMGGTWKSGREGKLSAAEWEEYGYSPRRRSVMYVVGECLVKQNKGPYRERYDSAKEAAAQRHADWSKLRCHRHAMLLASKLLLKNLWIEWNGEKPRETECSTAND